jgi:hypothetical protein
MICAEPGCPNEATVGNYCGEHADMPLPEGEYKRPPDITRDIGGILDQFIGKEKKSDITRDIGGILDPFSRKDRKDDEGDQW